MKIREVDTQLHQGAGGASQPFGETHRRYKFDVATDDFSIKIPAGVKFAAIVQPVQALHVQIWTAARVVTGGEMHVPLAAVAEEPMRVVQPDEFINISHADGSTAIGVFYLILEGKDLPEQQDFIVVSDPGA